MDLAQLPSFDDAVLALLALVGASTGVLALAGAAFAAHSWYEGIKGILRGAKATQGFLGKVGTLLFGMRPVKAVAAIAVTVLVPLAQALAVAMCYLGGNYLSIHFDEGRAQRISTVIEYDPSLLLDPAISTQLLVLDWISGAYLVLAAASIAWSYRRAWIGEEVNAVGYVLGLPAVVVLIFGIPLFLLGLAIWILLLLLSLLSGEGGETFGEMVGVNLPSLIILLTTSLYLAACQAAVHASRLTVRTWRG